MKVSRTTIHKALKASDKAFVCELDDGSRMVTNTYMAWKPGLATAEEFAHFNVDVTTPGSFTVNGTLTRTDLNIPNLQQLVSQAAGGQPAEFTTVAGKRVFAETGNIEVAFVNVHDGTIMAVNREFVAIVEHECCPDRWEAATNLKPLVAYRATTLVALIMPTRLASY